MTAVRRRKSTEITAAAAGSRHRFPLATKGIAAITFDAGGTLLHPHPSIGTVYAEVLSGHGLNLGADRLESAFHRAWEEAHRAPRIDLSEHGEKNWWKKVVRQTLKGMGKPRDFDLLFEELWHTFAEPRRWRLYRGAKETLAELKNRGYRLALLSNWDRRLRKLIEGMDLAPFFETLVISSEVEAEKPDPRIFRHAEHLLKIRPDRLLHVGDSIYHDVGGAKRAGWHWILIDHLNRPPTTRHTIGSIEALLDLLPGITTAP